MTAQQLEQLVPFLESQTAKVIMLADEPSQLPPQVQGFPTMSFIFSPDLIENAVAPVAIG